MRLFKVIAVLHIVLGLCLVIGVGLGALSFLLAADDANPAFSVYGLSFLAFIAVLIVYPGIRHLRAPSRKTALSLAGSSAALIWIISAGLTARVGATNNSYHFIAIGVALLIHRFGLKPMAEATFSQ